MSEGLVWLWGGVSLTQKSNFSREKRRGAIHVQIDIIYSNADARQPIVSDHRQVFSYKYDRLAFQKSLQSKLSSGQ